MHINIFCQFLLFRKGKKFDNPDSNVKHWTFHSLNEWLLILMSTVPSVFADHQEGVIKYIIRDKTHF